MEIRKLKHLDAPQGGIFISSVYLCKHTVANDELLALLVRGLSSGATTSEAMVETGDAESIS